MSKQAKKYHRRRWLTLTDEACKCDGCGRTILQGEKSLSSIQSCCSPAPAMLGCCRGLCVDCVEWAAKELEKAK